MLSLRQSQPKSSEPTSPEATFNLLPCRILHTGPANATRKLWNPATNEKGQKEAHFRGRRLLGRTLNLPEGYEAMVIDTASDVVLPADERLQMDEGLAPEVKEIKELAKGSEVIVWGHEEVVGDDEGLVKAVEEGVAWANAIAGWEDEEEDN